MEPFHHRAACVAHIVEKLPNTSLLTQSTFLYGNGNKMHRVLSSACIKSAVPHPRMKNLLPPAPTLSRESLASRRGIVQCTYAQLTIIHYTNKLKSAQDQVTEATTYNTSTTVEPLLTATPDRRPPAYYGHSPSIHHNASETPDLRPPVYSV